MFPIKNPDIITLKLSNLKTLDVSNEGDTLLLLAYCVLPHFKLAYCVWSYFGLAYCVPFKNKNGIFGVSI